MKPRQILKIAQGATPVRHGLRTSSGPGPHPPERGPKRGWRLSRGWLLFGLFSGVLLLLVFSASDLWARAGGGDGYSGPSSSGSGGSSSHGGGEGAIIELIIRLLIELCFHYPAIGIPLLIGFCVLLYYGANEGNEQYVGYKIQQGIKVQKQTDQSKVLANLTQRDPGFFKPAFLERAKKAFMLIQKAWSSQNLGDLQNFVSDGVYERFSLQVEEQKINGYRDQMENVRILESEIASMDSDANFDVLHVYFRASARDFRVSIKDGKPLSGKKGDEIFEEYWSFLRKPGVKSLKKPGLIEGFCPNCGAEIAIGQTTVCQYCSSLLRSGEYDWVLAEITQACEWSPAKGDLIPGLAAIQAKDPGFNIQHIEDRVSTIFWRKVAADRMANVAYLRKMAVDGYCDLFEEGLRGNSGTSHDYNGDCAVGKVDVKALSSSDDWDKVFVEVRWSGSPASADAQGRRLKVLGSARNIQSIFLLRRKPGVLTDTKSALVSSHCPNCSAPETTIAANSCEYCNTVLNDGKYDWILEKTLGALDREYVEVIRAGRGTAKPKFPGAESGANVGLQPDSLVSGVPPLTGKSAVDVLTCMTFLMFADEVIDPLEMTHLRQFAKKRNISEEKLNAIVEAVRLKTVTMPVPENRDQALVLIRYMSGMALADGRLADSEVQALNEFGSRLGFGAYDIKMIIKQEQKKLYDLAKQAVITSRKPT